MSLPPFDASQLPKIRTLTKQEKVTTAFLARGVPNRVIAERMGVRIGTVKNRSHAIFKKLGVNSRLAVAMQFGYEPPGPNPFLDAAIHVTTREADILSALTEGMDNKDVAANCRLGIENVKKLMSDVCKKTGFDDRTTIALYWRQAEATRAREAGPKPVEVLSLPATVPLDMPALVAIPESEWRKAAAELVSSVFKNRGMRPPELVTRMRMTSKAGATDPELLKPSTWSKIQRADADLPHAMLRCALQEIAKTLLRPDTPTAVTAFRLRHSPVVTG